MMWEENRIKSFLKRSPLRSESGIIVLTAIWLLAGPALWAMPPGPVIDTQPVSVVICVGDNTSFTVAATGSPPLTYQWYKDGSLLPGEVSDTLSINGAGRPDEGAFRVDVTDVNGTTMSSDANLTINPILPLPSDSGGFYNECSLSVNLNGNSPGAGVTGTWVVMDQPAGSNPTFTDPNDPNATFSTNLEGYYALDWQFSQGGCLEIAYVDIQVWDATETANAGPDQANCGVTATTLAATPPTIDPGSWSVVSGTGGSFGDPSSPTSSFNGTAGEIYTLQWTITPDNFPPPSKNLGITNPCPPSSDTVEIIFSVPPSTSDAGNDQTICNNITTLAATVPTIGTGTWSQISGPGTAVFSNTGITNPTADIGSSYGTYVFQWSVTTPGCSASNDTVTITYEEDPTTASAGPDQSICGLAGALAGNTIAVGTGGWTMVTGPGSPTFSDPNLANATINVTNFGTYTFRWTSTNGTCTSSQDDVDITFFNAPTAANAGPDDATCFSPYNLAANAPTVGTGSWSVVSGAGGSFGAPSSNTSTFSGVTGTVYTLRWTISNGPCTDSTDDVVITFTPDATTSLPGPDQVVCGPNATLAANTPTEGTGAWSIISGSGGSFSSTSDPAAVFTGLTGTTYRLGWTITGTCNGTADVVDITLTEDPTTATAGPDQLICGATATLAANTPATGTGNWTIVSGAGGSFVDPTNPTTQFSGSLETSYTLRWTISNSPCTDSTDDVDIHFKDNPTTSAAGPDQDVCGNSTTLAGNTPAIGNGTWSVISGTGGSFGDATDPNSSFTGVSGNSYTLRWQIINYTCPVSDDFVDISFTPNPTTADAGTDQNLCNTTTTLAGNTPTLGTGAWSIVSGTGGSFGNASSPSSSFSGTAGESYTLMWTVSNSPCTDSSDTVDITFTADPTTAAAGPDQTLCATAAILAANSPTVGSGSWSIISGSGGSFVSTTDPGTTFNGTGGETYTLRWTISNSPCSDSTDDVNITFTASPTTATAGPDQNLCGTSAVLAANTPTTGTGAWTVVVGSGGSFADASDPTTNFTGLVGSTYTLRWTISNSPCTDSTDEVEITFAPNPLSADAGTDQTVCSTSTTLAAVPAGRSGDGTWSIISGSGGSLGDTIDPNSTFTGIQGTTYTLRWTIDNSPCTDSTDDVIITMTADPTTANAGADQNVCGNVVVLTANTPSVGTGEWSIVSENGGSFSDENSPTATFTGTTGEIYDLRWTIRNSPCSSSSDTVEIRMTPSPTVAAAGTDQLLCATSTTLAANTATIGSGTWSVVSGAGGTFDSTSNPSALFSGVAGTSYTLRWTISNAPCPDSTDDVVIAFTEDPTTANAGSDILICAGPATLAANAPTVGTGSWSVAVGDGNGAFGDASSPSSAFSGTAGFTYTLRWTISNGVCTSSSDDVNVNISDNVTMAQAGTDQNLCSASAVLAANTPTVGDGTWTIVSGNGGAISNPSSPSSGFTGVRGESYTLRWTIANTPCPDSSDDVVITLYEEPTIAAAGQAQILCATSATLGGNTPTVGTGDWSIVSGPGGTFADASNPTTTFSGTAGVSYTLRWSISNGPCTASQENVTITFTENPTTANAGTDQTVCSDATVLAATAPTVGSGSWSVVSGDGNGVFGDTLNATSSFNGTRGLTYVLRWTTSNTPCPDSSDDVSITLTQEPTVAAAGVDQNVCADNTVLAGNTPTSGVGSWTIVSGAGGVLSDASNPTSAFTGTRGVSYALRWSIDNAPCTLSSDDVTIALTEETTVANAGTDQNVCADNTTLAANTATAGTGSWSILSGTGGSLADAANPTTAFSGTQGEVYTLRWTITNAPCADSTDDVTVTFTQEPTTANAGPDQNVCADTTTLAANSAAVGTGSWSIISGTGGSLADAADPASAFNGTQGETYILRWTITNSPCVDSTDDVTVIFTQEPTIANAGADQDVCADNTTLAANSAAVGTGSWSVISGTGGVFANATDPATSFSGTQGEVYTLRWTISNAPCVDSTDDVTITFTQAPTTANAGTDQNLCADNTILAANAPTVGSGSWSVVSGAGGVFADATSPASSFSGTQGETYVLRWTIANAPCVDSTDDVTVIFTQEPTTANAGTDQNVCADNTTLAANAPTVGSGSWSVVSGAGGVFADATSPASSFSGTQGESYILRWTIANAPCVDSTDDVTVTFTQEPTIANAGVDQNVCADNTILAANAPTVGSGSWSVVSGAGGVFADATSPASSFSGTQGETYVLRWTIANAPCVDSTDDVTVTFTQEPTTANAGADQNVCADNTILAANAPTVGSGSWSVISGSGGVFADATSPATSFSGTQGETYVLRWTIANAPCVDSTDDVAITLTQEPTTANAGVDQTICDDNTILAANAPTVGSGLWSVISGTGGVFADATNPTTSFSGSRGVVYELRWTVSNAPCTDSTDDVSITLTEEATLADAGTDQEICADNTALAANTPAIGTGLWSVVSGDGNGAFTDNTNPTTAFSGTRGVAYSLRWTITNDPCPASSDDVTISFFEEVTPPAAGDDQDFCGDTVTLAANAPEVGVGAWTILSGTNGTIADPTNPASSFSGERGQSYELQWTITNAPCDPASDNVVINLVEEPTTANAGVDQEVCADNATLAANAPEAGSGLWSIQSGDGGAFADPANPTTVFTGTAGNTYVLVWTISNSPCDDSTDTVEIILVPEPTTADAGPDQTIFDTQTATLAANAPEVGTGAWTVSSGPSTDSTQFADTTDPLTVFTPAGGTGDYVLTWTTSNTVCPETTDDMTLTVSPLTSVTWTNTSGGNWSNPDNWDPAVLPTSDTNVAISEDGAYTVVLDVSTQIASLSLTGSGLTFQHQSSLSITNGMTVGAGATLVFTGSLNAGAEALGANQFSNSGTVSLNGSAALNLPIVNNGGFTINALDGATAQLTGSSSFTNNGTLSLTSSGAAATARINLTGVLTNETGGTVNSLAGSGGDRVFACDIVNRGEFNIQTDTTYDAGAAKTALGGSSFANAGILNIGGSGGLTFNGGVFTNQAGGVIDGTGTLDVSNAVFNNQGTIEGGGIEIVGDAPMNQDSIINITLEAGGSVTGQLQISGGTTLAGTLNVALGEGFTPVIGDNFQLILYTSADGAFDQVNLPELPIGLGFETNQGAEAYSIGVVKTLSDISFSTAAFTIGEDVGSATILITRSAPLEQSATVRFSTSDGTAVAGEDYTAVDQVVTFAEGVSSAAVPVRITDDTQVEDPLETLTLTLSEPDGALLIEPSSATLSIEDNDNVSRVSFNLNARTVSEGALGTSLTIVRQDNPDLPLSLTATTSSGSATAGSDFISFVQVVNLPAGEESTPLAINIIDDDNREGNESFTVSLVSNDGNAVVTSPNVATITITDNDNFTGAFTSSSQTVSESAGTANVVLALSSSTNRSVSFDYSVAGSADSGDHGLSSGSITVPAGSTSATLTVPINDDSLDEQDETIVISLASNEATGSPSTHTITITDNDSAVAAFALDTTRVTEGSGGAATSVAVNLQLNTPADRPLGVSYSVSGLAESGSDHNLSSGSATFAAGSLSTTITFDVVGDDEVETNETIIIAITGGDAVVGSPNRHVVTIEDDDELIVSWTSARQTIEEGNISKRVAVTVGAQLNRPAPSVITVPYTVGGAATFNEDHNLTPGTIQFAAGANTASVTFDVIEDNTEEADEAVILILTEASVQLGAIRRHVVTIDDDDENQSPETAINNPIDGLTWKTGVTLAVDASGSDPQNDTIEFFWEICSTIGNCAFRTGQSLDNVSFETPGVYIFTCYTRDQFGNEDNSPARATVNVVDNISPSAVITSPAGDPDITTGESISFQASATDPDSEVSGEFYFSAAPDTTFPGDTFDFTFSEAGVFNLVYRATDAEGATDTDWRTITVSDSVQETVSVNISSPADGAAFELTESLSFIGSVSGGDVSGYKTFWDLGDGRIESGSELSSVTYDSVGRYTVTFFAVNNTTGDRVQDQVTVFIQSNAQPVVDFEFPTDLEIQPGQDIFLRAVTVDSVGFSSLDFFWSISDGRSFREATPGRVQFENEGVYAISLHATTPAGIQSEVVSRTLTVRPANDERFEPNEDFTQASPLTPGLYENLEVTPNSPDDFYRVDVTAPGQRLLLRMNLEGVALVQIFDESQVEISSRTITTTGNIQLQGLKPGVYYIKISAAPESKRMGFSYGIAISVLNPALFFPDIQVNEGFDTQLGIVNATNSEASLEALGYDRSGNIIARVQLELPALGRCHEPVSRLFGDDAERIAWVQIDSTNDLLGYARSESRDLKEMYATTAVKRLSSELYAPHIAQATNQWKTRAAVVNGSDLSSFTRLETPGQDIDLELDGGFKQDNFDFVDRFGGQLPEGVEWARFKDQDANFSLAGVEVFGTVDDTRIVAGLELADIRQDNPNFTFVGNNLYFTHIARDVDNFYTGIALVNISAFPQSIRITGFNPEGIVNGSKVVEMPAGGRIVQVAEDFLDGIGEVSNTDWFLVEADNEIVGFELFGTRDGNRLAGLEASTALRSELCYPFIDTDPGVVHGFSIVNVNQTGIDLAFTLYDNNGDVLAEVTRSLNATQKFIFTIDQLFENVNLPEDRIPGWLGVRTDLPIAGFELFLNTGEQMGAIIAQ